jgi:hypothetical protein
METLRTDRDASQSVDRAFVPCAGGDAACNLFSWAQDEKEAMCAGPFVAGMRELIGHIENLLTGFDQDISANYLEHFKYNRLRWR